MGVRHREVRDKLRTAIERAQGFRIISVEGEAGVGKTRSIYEALLPLEGGRAFVVRLLCDPATGEFDFAPLLALVRDANPDASMPEWPDVSDAVSAVEIAGLLPLPLVLVLEDLPISVAREGEKHY